MYTYIHIYIYTHTCIHMPIQASGSLVRLGRPPQYRKHLKAYLYKSTYKRPDEAPDPA